MIARTLKSLARYALGFTPYQVRRRPRHPELPGATFDNIQLVLAYYRSCRPAVTFVQIGACDGVSGDPVHEAIKQGTIRALLVEPIEESFQKLRQAYSGIPNVSTAQVAVGESDGESTFYKVKAGAQSIDPYWSRQLASFDRNHILRHGVAEDEIEAVKVPCLTLSSLFQKFGLTQVDVLQIDTEGFDAEVVEMALQLPTLPDCINFENVHLAHDKVAELYDKLEAKGYVWTHDKWNTLALHQRFVAELNHASESKTSQTR